MAFNGLANYQLPVLPITGRQAIDQDQPEIGNTVLRDDSNSPNLRWNLLINLDLAGISVSTGSACASGSTDPSHVLQAMGVPKDLIEGSLRFSLGWGNTDEDVDRVIEVLPDIVARLRAVSGKWDAAKVKT